MPMTQSAKLPDLTIESTKTVATGFTPGVT